MHACAIPGQTPIQTTADGLRHGMVNLPTFDGQIAAYHAVQRGRGNAPIVLVVQEIFGLNEHTQDICRRLAHAGYFALALEHYQRQGNPGDYTQIADLLSQLVARVPDEQVLADLDAAARWAAEQGGDGQRLAVTGFCWGGRIVWLYAAHNPVCRAGVAWYGKLATGHGSPQHARPLDIARQLHAPVLGLYGGQDASIPLEDVSRMQAMLADGSAASRASRIIVYPQAGHAFYADYRASYRAEDAQAGWQQMLAWFEQHLEQRSG